MGVVGSHRGRAIEPDRALAVGVDELAPLLSEPMQLLTELGNHLSQLDELNREGGHVIEASAEITEQLLVVEAGLNVGVIAPTAIVASSAVNLSDLFPSVSSIAEVDREPSTTMRAPRKVHRA